MDHRFPRTAVCRALVRSPSSARTQDDVKTAMAHRILQDPRLLGLPRNVAGRARKGHTALLGIDGGAGAGKSTFAEWLAERIRVLGPGVTIVPIDGFFRPAAERVGYPSPLAVIDDIDGERLRDEVVLPLRSGRAARYRLYDWVGDGLGTRQEIEPGGVVIVDGVTALRRELRTHYDLRVWVSCPRDVRVARLSRRAGSSDAEIRRWLPSEDRYVAEQAPRDSAHLVLESTSREEGAGEGRWSVVRWSLPTSTGDRGDPP